MCVLGKNNNEKAIMVFSLRIGARADQEDIHAKLSQVQGTQDVLVDWVEGVVALRASKIKLSIPLVAAVCFTRVLLGL
jgi:hypothetical protein